MKYSIIKLKGHQYKVTEGDEILVDSLKGEKADPKVLLMVNDGKIDIGTPVVEKAKIALTMVGEEDEKGEKIHVFKFKSKSRYRRKSGFRAKLTRLKVESIS